MEVSFDYLPEFERRAKALAKHYKSFQKDYNAFLDSLEANPFQGVSLGEGVYKTRMQSAPKEKEKVAAHECLPTMSRMLNRNACKSPDVNLRQK